MSQLEEAAKSIALPLIRGESAIITPYQQKLLAAWCCLMTIMAEFMTDTPAIPASSRKWMMEHREPDSTFRVHIGRYVGTNAHQHWCRHIPMSLSLDPPAQADDFAKANSQSTTMVIGQLCINTFSSPIVDAFFVNYTGPILYQIWPVTEADLRWPGLSALDDLQVITLAEAFRGKGIEV